MFFRSNGRSNHSLKVVATENFGKAQVKSDKLDRVMLKYRCTHPVILLLLISSFVTLHTQVVYAQIVAGKITRINGDASITRAGRRFPATYLAAVELADQIVTNANGRVTVTLTDNSQLELAESTTLIVSEDLLNPNGTRARTTLTVLSGLVRSWVKMAAGAPPNYEVHTPNAVASARGTTYDTYYTNHETRRGFKNCKEFTDVFDYDGIVLVRSLSNPSSPPVLLHSGQKTTVPCGLPISQATALAAAADVSGLGTGAAGDSSLAAGAAALGIVGLSAGAIVGGYAAAGGFDPASGASSTPSVATGRHVASPSR